MSKTLIVFICLLFSASTAFAAGDALVYKGPGSCDENCSEAAALMATLAGLNPVFVGPSEKDPAVFENAVVWIQPGGNAQQAARTMSAGLKRMIQNFIRTGGGYVGFCAGGFLATTHIGELSTKGLAILPGRTYYVEQKEAAKLFSLKNGGKSRSVYWEGGPTFNVAPGYLGAEIMWTYPDGTTAAVRSHFGTGRVYVTGLHPEAPQGWRNYFQLQDDDGLDYDLAVDMIRWAKKTRKKL